MNGTQRTFFSRLSSSAILWCIALVITFSGHHVAFFLLISSLAMLGLWEYFAMLDHKGIPHFRATGMVCAFVFLAGSFFYFQKFGLAHAYDFEGSVSVFLLLVLFGRQMFGRTREVAPLAAMAFTVFGLLYIPTLFNFMTKIVFAMPENGQFYVLYLVVVSKFSDMGAYLTGMMIGKHPMAPLISPKKTWEGFAGAICFSMLGSFGLLWLIPHKLAALDSTHALILGLLIGVSAVIGDLAESVLKRSCDVKDSGHMLPGIGGVLDLIDSLLFTGPILFFYLRLVAHGV